MNARRSVAVLVLGIGLLLQAGCGAHVYHVVKPNETVYSISFRYGQDYRDVARWNSLDPPYELRVGETIRIIAPTRSASRTTSAATATGLQSAPEGGEPAVAASRVAPMEAQTFALEPQSASVIEPSPAISGAQTGPLEPAASTAVAPAIPAGSRPAPVAPRPAPAEPRTAPVEQPRTVPAEPRPAPAAAAKSGQLNWSWPVSGIHTRSDLSVKPSRRGLEIAAARGEPVRAAASGRVVYSGSGIPHYGNMLIIKHNEQFLSAYAHNDRLLVSEGQEVAAGQQIAEMGDSGTGTGSVKLLFEIRQDGDPVDPMKYLPGR